MARDPQKIKKALVVIPKPDKAKEQELIGDENIDPEILKALGLNDVTDLDYGEYSSLLKEKMMANQMGSGGGLDQGKLKDEYKRVRGKTGKFKVKNQKITPSSFVAKTKPSTAVATVTPKLPPAAPQEEVTQVVDPKRQSADKTFALIASKLEIVDKNVQETAAYLTKKDVAEKKEKDAAKKEAQDVATAERENRTENRNIFAAIPGVVGAAVKPIKDALGGFFDGLKRLGFAIFIMELMRFLKDPAKYINDIIDWTNKQIKKLETSVENFVIDKMVKPMNGMIKDLNSKITDFVGIINPLLEKLSLLGISPIDTNSLQVPEIKESDIRNGIAIPQVPNVNDNFLDSIKLDGSDEGDEPEATPSQSTPEATPSQSTPEARPQETLMGQQPSQSGNGLTPQQKAFAETVSYAEGTSGSAGYNTWFGGSQYGGDLSKKTINEVVALQKKFLAEGRGKFDGGRQQSAAVGKYQMTYPETYAKAAGLNPAVDKFTPENQDKMAIAGYMMGQAGMSAAEIDAPISREQIAKMAPVWASLPNMSGASQYGQPVKKYEDLVSVYEKNQKGLDASSFTASTGIAAAPGASSSGGSGGGKSSEVKPMSAEEMSDLFSGYKTIGKVNAGPSLLDLYNEQERSAGRPEGFKPGGLKFNKPPSSTSDLEINPRSTINMQQNGAEGAGGMSDQSNAYPNPAATNVAPSNDLPEIDANAMISQDKIKVLGITVV